MLELTGVPTSEEIEKVYPCEARLNSGATVIIECFQNIPCNPCYTACKTGAIKEFKDINDLPTVDYDLCNGCGLCISNCPGLSIIVLDMAYSEKEALLKLPYEFSPLPSKGQRVMGLDREGNEVCEVEVIKVVDSKGLDKTPIISLALDKEYAKTVRNIRLEEYL